MTPALYERCQRAIHVITSEGRVLRAGRAVLFILERCGFKWTARVLRAPPLVWMVELGYWLVARNRRFFARFLFRKG
jgi:predicted DCC family thiol-disulfide oxidoreductase YuxK